MPESGSQTLTKRSEYWGVLRSILTRICLNVFTHPTSLPCGHTFCKNCIGPWISSHSFCAQCRHSATLNQLVTNYQLQSVIEQLSSPKIIPTSDLTEVLSFNNTNVAEISFCLYQGEHVVWKVYRSVVNGVSVDGNKIASRHYSIVKALDFPTTLVRVFGITASPPGIIIEKLSNSLQFSLENNVVFTFEESLLIAKDIISAVKVLHSYNFVHRDLSAGNVFLKLSDSGTVLGAKVGDLDQVKESNSTSTTHFIGTVAYVAPEVLKNEPNQTDKPVDVFALGVLLFALFTCSDPSRKSTNSLTLMSIRISQGYKALIDLDLIKDGALSQLIGQMVNMEPSLRPTIEQIFSFFNQQLPSAPVFATNSPNTHHLTPNKHSVEDSVLVTQLRNVCSTSEVKVYVSNVQTVSIEPSRKSFFARLFCCCSSCSHPRSSQNVSVIDSSSVESSSKSNQTLESQLEEMKRLLMYQEEERKKKEENENRKRLLDAELEAHKKQLDDIKTQTLIAEMKMKLEQSHHHHHISIGKIDPASDLASEKPNEMDEFLLDPMGFLKFPREFFVRLGGLVKFIPETMGRNLSLCNSDSKVRSESEGFEQSFVAINHPKNGKISLTLTLKGTGGRFCCCIGYFDPSYSQTDLCFKHFTGISPFHLSTDFIRRGVKDPNITTALKFSSSIDVTFSSSHVCFSTPHSGWSRTVNCENGWVFGISCCSKMQAWSLQ
ncbi:hypothetical protein RCL1_005022 [Eukaryota sp. TZLM3-RCL]